VVKEEMVVVAKGKLLKSRLPRRSEKRKALDAKSAGTQHRHASARKESPAFSNPMRPLSHNVNPRDGAQGIRLALQSLLKLSGP
jgi:hypothetical protein